MQGMQTWHNGWHSARQVRVCQACIRACTPALELTGRSSMSRDSVLTQGASKELIVVQMSAPLH